MEQATYSSRNKGIFLKQSKWSHFLKKNKKNTNPRAKRFPFAINQVLAKSNIILEQMWFKDAHCGSHLGFQNWKILAIMNLHLAPMPSIKFQLNLTYGLGGDVVWIFYNFYPKNACYLISSLVTIEALPLKLQPAYNILSSGKCRSTVLLKQVIKMLNLEICI